MEDREPAYVNKPEAEELEKALETRPWKEKNDALGRVHMWKWVNRPNPLKLKLGKFENWWRIETRQNIVFI